MIYTVTFNPAIDYVVHSDSDIKIGQVNRVCREEIYYGGKGINVSIVLNNLGIESVALGFIAGFTGSAVEEGIREYGIKSDFIKLSSGITRVNIKIKGEKETDINAEGPTINENEINMLFSKISKLADGDILVLAGSIPKTLPADIYEKIILMLSGKDIKIIVDTTGDLLLNVLKYSPFLIKPNIFELEEIIGKRLNGDDEVICAAKKLQDMGVENVLVSMGSDGAILISEDGNVYKSGVASGKAVNTVGAGDSMVAGFIAGYIKTDDYGLALKYGSAAGSATALSSGLAQKQDVIEILKKL